MLVAEVRKLHTTSAAVYFLVCPTEQCLKSVPKWFFVISIEFEYISSVFSVDRCNFWEAEKAVQALNWIGRGISCNKANNSEHFGHFRFPIPAPNWHFFIKVWTYVIGLSCLLRRILEYEKVRQFWTLQYGVWLKYLSLHRGREWDELDRV